MKLGNLTYILWMDATGCPTDWQDISTVHESVHPYIESVGWLYEHKDYPKTKYVVIVPHVDGKGDDNETNALGWLAIPKSTIVKQITMAHPFKDADKYINPKK
jgi:hypothetical protein